MLLNKKGILGVSLISILSMILGCSQNHLIGDSETIRINQSPTIHTRDKNRLPVAIVDVGSDSVHAITDDRRRIVIARTDVEYIHEQRGSLYPYSIIGALALGSWAYFSTPDDNDPLANPEYWAAVYGGLGAGIGYYISSITSDGFRYYLDEEAYKTYVNSIQ